LYEGDEFKEDIEDVEELCCAAYRSGEEGLRDRVKLDPAGRPRTGELLLSTARGVYSSSKIAPFSLTLRSDRTGMTGNASSTGFRGTRTRLGDPSGLAGRCIGEDSKCPLPLTPGIDCALIIGGASGLVEDFDRRWPLEKGDVFRGRYAREEDARTGDRGDCGEGSVLLRRNGGFGLPPGEEDSFS
jgi:hypothetical protein